MGPLSFAGKLLLKSNMRPEVDPLHLAMLERYLQAVCDATDWSAADSQTMRAFFDVDASTRETPNRSALLETPPQTPSKSSQRP